VNIQLFNPPIWHYAGFYYRMLPTLSLPTIAAVLNKAGHYAETVDLEALQVHPDTLRDTFKSQADHLPDVVGLTALTITARGAHDCVKALRDAGFNKRIVVGGIYATEHPEEVLDWGVDLVVTGECEGNLVELMESGQGIQRGEKAPITDIPSPDWKHHNPPIETYWGNTALVRPHPGIAMWTRGCPFKCIFCSNKIFNGASKRYRDPIVIGAEMRELKQRGCENVYVYDDELVGSPIPTGWMKRVADEVGPVGLRWITQGRCSKRFVTPELMADVKRAGCKAIFWGIESLSPKVLKAMKKRITPDDILHTLRVSREAGIDNGAFTMVGNYLETEEDLAITRDALAQAYNDGLIQYRQTTICTVMDGTELADIAKLEGWYTKAPDTGEQMAQVFTGTPWLSKEQIDYWKSEFIKACPVGVPV